MHLTILLVGLLAGPYAGAISGFLGPLASFVLSGMPGIAMLPFMMIELCIYGLAAGLLCNVKMPTIGKVVAAAILLAVYAFGNENIDVAVIWTSISAGVFGLALQWALLPLIAYPVQQAVRILVILDSKTV